MPCETSSPVIDHMLQKLADSKETDDFHGYLINKNVPNYDLSLDSAGNLLGVGVNLKKSFQNGQYVPQIQTLLTIPREGSPTFEPGTETKGAALMIGHQGFRKMAREPQKEQEILLARDYATGAALHQKTGLPVAVFFEESNLRKVAQILRKKFPLAKITIYINIKRDSILDEAWRTAQAVEALIAPFSPEKNKPQISKTVSSIQYLSLGAKPPRKAGTRPKKAMSA